MTTSIRIATINLFRDLSRWPERRQLLIRELAGLSLDLIALQEVTNPLGFSSAHWLAEELGGYSVVVSSKTGWERRREGIAVLSRWPVEGQETIDLGSQNRVAQIVQVQLGEHLVRLVNGHYFFPVGAHRAQVKQVGRVLGRIGPGFSEPVIVCGDFNATPRCRSIALMRQTFQSAHYAHHQREPEFTCPTRLISGGKVRRTVATSVFRLLSIHPSDVWRGTLDYIFVSPEIRVIDCGVILDRPSPEDPTLYASDHLGMAATLEIPSTAAG
jgi:endonuclease/exonuclease/phosphatase family metal-dependent hydrolase